MTADQALARVMEDSSDVGSETETADTETASEGEDNGADSGSDFSVGGVPSDDTSSSEFEGDNDDIRAVPSQAHSGQRDHIGLAEPREDVLAAASTERVLSWQPPCLVQPQIPPFTGDA
ncbi:hypothetical protein NDU88_001929 [Pleurodeles waltl]|uniref:Uncharacterized protein n=1 Tax=Pleurodeles waltl TaxID=8319 RepID=A0AAV7WJY6_PLEWA|nr:hypothetical protein NDU88_001929 [Pleurodeles waltl]